MLDTLKDWLGTYWKILLVPTPKTFMAESRKADGKTASAVVWLLFYAAYLCIMANILIGPSSFIGVVSVVVLVPLAVFLLASLMHFAYQWISHRKNYVYDQLLYLTVAILLPLEFVFVPVALVLPGPFGPVLAFIVLLYQVGLLVIALASVAKIEIWEALISVFIGIIGTVPASIIVALLIYATMANPGVSRSH